MEYATRQSEKARDNALRMERKNVDKIKELERCTNQVETNIQNIKNEIAIKTDEVSKIDSLLKNIETSFEPSGLLV